MELASRLVRNMTIDEFMAVMNPGLQQMAETYYVDRNTGRTGDGKSWGNAFLTISEAIGQVNADYIAATNNPRSSGRMRRIIIGEGWYSEVPVTLTANDVHILAISPGSHNADGTVLYGSATAGGWDAPSGAAALTIEGSSITIEGLGFDNLAAGLYPAVQVGNADNNVFDVAFKGSNWVQGTADSYDYAVRDAQLAGALYEKCIFGPNSGDGGIYFRCLNAQNKPVSPKIVWCDFIGTPVGIATYSQCHNMKIVYNTFMSDAALSVTMNNPLNVAAGSSGIAAFNMCPDTSLAAFNVGGAGLVEKGNICSDSDADLTQ